MESNVRKNICGKIKRAALDDKGAAMIIVTCVMSIIMILCLAVLTVSYQMFATVNDEAWAERYYEQAYSFGETLRYNLTDREKAENLKQGSLESYIYGFVRDNRNYPVSNGTDYKVTLPAASPDAGMFPIRLTLTKSLEYEDMDDEDNNIYVLTVKIENFAPDDDPTKDKNVTAVSCVTERFRYTKPETGTDEHGQPVYSGGMEWVAYY